MSDLISMTPPPSHATLERCLAIIPKGWGWVLTTRAEGYFCHIMAPDFDGRLTVEREEGGIVYWSAPEQPMASFKGYGPTPLDALTEALRVLEAI